MPTAFYLVEAVLKLVLTAPLQGEAADYGVTPDSHMALIASPSPFLTIDFVYDITLCHLLFCTASFFCLSSCTVEW